MPNVLEEIEEVFGNRSFYSILNIVETASKNEIRKAYYQLSLQVHPDRVGKSESEQAKKKFQALGKIYEVLSDESKRALYDETGTVDDECSVGHEDRDWYEYWRLLFAPVKMEDIQQFEKRYKGSKEELNDLKKAYLDAKGDMDQIIDTMMCATVEDDESRFRSIIQDWINKKTVKAFDAFTREKEKKRASRKRKATAEALEAEEALKKLSKSAESGLSALIQRNQKSRSEQADSFFARLEEKYGGKSHSKRSTSKSARLKSPKRATTESPIKKSAKQTDSAATKAKNGKEKSPRSTPSSSPVSKRATKSPQSSPAKSKKGSKKPVVKKASKSKKQRV